MTSFNLNVAACGHGNYFFLYFVGITFNFLIWKVNGTFRETGHFTRRIGEFNYIHPTNSDLRLPVVDCTFFRMTEEKMRFSINHIARSIPEWNKARTIGPLTLQIMKRINNSRYVSFPVDLLKYRKKSLAY